jgi:hypothetical protein
MAIDWSSVGSQMGASVKGVVGPAWQNASTGASVQFAALLAAGQQIELNKDSMQQAEYDSLKLMQQRALEGVLQSYEGITLDVAEEAACAAWEILVSAISTAYPALAFLV